MTDDLVKELRFWNGGHMSKEKMTKAADRIEHLESINLKQSLIKIDDMARIEQLEAALKRATLNLMDATSLLENGGTVLQTMLSDYRKAIIAANAALEGKPAPWDAVDRIEALEGENNDISVHLEAAMIRIDELEQELRRLIKYGMTGHDDLQRARAVLGEISDDD